ncbi:iron complex outermembrane recepter protein [Pseudoxanthomonas sp. GM95]|uniref:TonB-dependent receptor family protein n=1 Tax=Pseudoxanthomonas sp. GM95 TaxID=1881043 RepID=UPI0008CF9851|nr:TonB-dependent receptor [Pseudoxanthomonas sp. GM95]SEK64754.1 iron complex outermembrane recepter protein [Pseudoxanthomonas sp. GM95]
MLKSLPCLRPTALAIALACAFPDLAHAADTPAVATVDADPAVAEASDAKQLDSVSVVAPGVTRQVQRVSQQDIERLTPGSSPLKAIDKLPGVQFQSADATGAYEWATAIYLHGFDQSRLGFTLDGVPLGNMSYGVTNGLSITRAIQSENIGSVELAQGAGALGTASNSNLGGTLQFYSADPSSEFGARVSQTFGSDSAKRTFVRVDTGDFNGFSAYASYASSDMDKWKGDGIQKYEQFNTKAVYAWGDGNRISLFVDKSRRKEQDYMDLSLVSQKALGWNWDYLTPDWATASQMANAYQTTGAYAGVANGYPTSLAALPDDYDWLDSTYYWGAGLRDDTLASLAGSFNLGGAATLDVTGYYHGNRGEGQWITPYVPSVTESLSMRTTDYGLDRFGATGALKFTVGIHDIEIGGWAENSQNTQERNYFLLDAPLTTVYNFYDVGTPFLRQFLQKYQTNTRMAYVQDTMHLMDERLTVNFGAKAISTETTARSLVASSSYAQGSIKADDSFLPQVGASYKLDEAQDVYASYSKNMAAFDYSPFATGQVTFDSLRSTLKPEESQTLQLGYRVHGDQIEASAGVYYTQFKNRLLTTSPCSAIQTCSAILSNVGDVESTGVDLAVIWKPIDGLSWLNTVSLDRSKYQDDYLNNGVVETSGKYVVGIPSVMVSSSLNYRLDGWKFGLDGKYTGRRYITYLNDSRVPAYTVFNVSAGYDFGQVGFLSNVGVSLNITNLADKRYFATTGTNGYVAADPDGYNQTLMAGAPRQAFFTLDASF